MFPILDNVLEIDCIYKGQTALERSLTVNGQTFDLRGSRQGTRYATRISRECLAQQFLNKLGSQKFELTAISGLCHSCQLEIKLEASLQGVNRPPIFPEVRPRLEKSSEIQVARLGRVVSFSEEDGVGTVLTKFYDSTKVLLIRNRYSGVSLINDKQEVFLKPFLRDDVGLKKNDTVVYVPEKDQGVWKARFWVPLREYLVSQQISLGFKNGNYTIFEYKVFRKVNADGKEVTIPTRRGFDLRDPGLRAAIARENSFLVKVGPGDHSWPVSIEEEMPKFQIDPDLEQKLIEDFYTPKRA